ncbi:MAG: hypothetical protein ACRDRW_07930 [Pseudonocardiaceae bacterium]
MARIGITGHVNLSRRSVPLVAEALRDVLKNYNEAELVGFSCLARGSDQIFARVVLECGGAVDVVLPAADYRERKIKPDNLWDGNPSGGYSGTADVVAAARERGIPVTVVWPDGARRE